MRLFSSPASPFVRKVRACAAARGLDGQIEVVTVDVGQSPAELLAVNPLSKIPALVTDDGLALYDSPVICEYLDSLGDAAPLFPPAGGPRWRALRLQAMGDGIMDAAVRRRGESLRPVEAARTALMERDGRAISRTLAELEREPPHLVLDIGTIAVASALAYLDLRFPDQPWRPEHPRLAEWHASIETEPALAATGLRAPA